MTEYDVLTLARTVYGEARGEPLEGKIAVAFVPINRKKSRRWFGRGSLSAICEMPRQFSCWNKDDPNRFKLLNVGLDDAMFQDCLYATLAALRGHVPDPTDGATHYYAAWINPPKWAKEKKPSAVIGQHRFYCGIA